VAFGVYAIEYSTASIFIAVLAGVVGVVLTKLDYPAVPLILGLVLGPMLERNIRRTLIQSQGDLLVFVERPIALTLFLLTIAALLIPVMLKALDKQRIPADEAEA
jgi:putative tricarboxylic transport membrane protein